MPDDWSWFWAGEHGRDRMLRAEIEGLQDETFSARAQSARLSSQLSELQGSLESRLNALSTAFDAYVELGDVRIELAGYPDSSAVRRDAARAVEELSRGLVPPPIDDRGLDYWLSDAVNEVIAIAGGTDIAPAPAAAPPSPAGSEAELFVVAAVGALGQGPRVGPRVAGLLVGDARLSARQVVVWQAARVGVFGPVLADVGAVWRPLVDQDATGWVDWVRRTGRVSGALESLRYLDRVYAGADEPVAADRLALVQEPSEQQPSVQGPPTGESGVDPAPQGGPVTALRLLVEELVDQGMGDEAALLERARVLRTRIEDPLARVPDADTAETAGATVTDEVRSALADPTTPTAARVELLSWAKPGLQAAAARFAAESADARPTALEVSTTVGTLLVTPQGADPSALAVARERTVAAHATARSRLLAPGVALAVLLVLGLVGFRTISSLGVLALIGAVGSAVVLGRELLAARTRRADLVADLSSADTEIAERRAVAATYYGAFATDQDEAAELARRIARR